MSGPGHPPIDGQGPLEPSLPPIAELAVVTLMLVVAGGIYLASYMPHHVPLGVAVGLLVAAAAVLVANVVMLGRLPEFAWGTFFLVAKWALAAYVVIAGMLEYVFVYDHTPGGVLTVLTLMLVVFAVNVPLVLGFTVARYQEPDDRSRPAVGSGSGIAGG